MSVCPCMSEALCMPMLSVWASLNKLSCTLLVTESASSSSWGGSPTRFLTRNTCLTIPPSPCSSPGKTLYTYIRTYFPPLPLPLPHTHCVQLCYGLFCPPFQYEPSKDVFNAAQSGAMIPNLVDHEFDYLYREVRDVSLCSIAVRLL